MEIVSKGKTGMVNKGFEHLILRCTDILWICIPDYYENQSNLGWLKVFRQIKINFIFISRCLTKVFSRISMKLSQLKLQFHNWNGTMEIHEIINSCEFMKWTENFSTSRCCFFVWILLIFHFRKLWRQKKGFELADQRKFCRWHLRLA